MIRALLLAALLAAPAAAREPVWLRYQESLSTQLLIDTGDSRVPRGQALQLSPRVTYHYQPLRDWYAPTALWPWLQRRTSVTLGADLLGGTVSEPAGIIGGDRPRQTRLGIGTSASAYLRSGSLALLVGAGYSHASWIGPPIDVHRDQIEWHAGVEGAWDRFHPPLGHRAGASHLTFTHHGFVRRQLGETFAHIDGELALSAVSLPSVHTGVAFTAASEWAITGGRQNFFLISTRGFLDVFFSDSIDLYTDLTIAVTQLDWRAQPTVALRYWRGSRFGISAAFHGDFRGLSGSYGNRELLTLDITLTGRFR